ncbi:uncharacterized protein LOC120341376 [Styela clava]
MEDSVDSNILLVVPSSIEDSVPVGGDNPLGISSKTLHPATASISIEAGTDSFSCFQLSGRETQDSKSESSESLHIDERDVDIIPQSPKELHIELSDTPSAHSNSNTEPNDSYQNCDCLDMDSGKMSPDLMASSEGSLSSSNPVITSQPDEYVQQAFPSLEFTSPKSQSQSPTLQPNTVNPYEADTESYTPSDFPPPANLEEPSRFSNFLGTCAIEDNGPSPIILTANTETNSELKDNNSDFINKELQEKGDQSCEKINNSTMENGKIPAEYDLDSNDIIIEDVNMRKIEDDEAVNKETDEETAHDNVSSIQHEGVTQEFTQDLNLHLTIESQLFDSSSFPPADDSQCLVIDEELESVGTLGLKKSKSGFPDVMEDEQRGITENARDHIHDSITEPKLHSDSGNDCLTGKKQNKRPKSPNSPFQSSENGFENASSLETISVTKSITPEIVDNIHESTVPKQNLESQAGSNENSYGEIKNRNVDTRQSTSIELEQNVADSSGAERMVTAPSPHIFESCSITDHQLVVESSDSSSKTGGNNSNPPATNHMKHDINITGSNHNEVPQSESDRNPVGSISKSTGSQDISPSMQSTYIDENNNNNSLQKKQIVDDTLDSMDGSLPIQTGESYDASAEYSSQDRDENLVDSQSLMIGDLETQPFSMTPLRGSKISTYEDSQSLIANGSASPPTLDTDANLTEDNKVKHTDDTLVEDIKDILNGIINDVESQKIVSISSPINPVTDERYERSKITRFNSVNKGNLNGQLNNQNVLNESALKSYDYLSQSQPSQDIHLKTPFLSPVSPVVAKEKKSVRRRSKDKKQRKDKPSHMDMDSNNNNVNNKDNANEEHDKSSDTLPLDDNDQSPGPDSDPLISPNKSGNHILYRVTRNAVVETLVNGEVVETKTVHKRPKYYKTNPYHHTSSQSSNGSGYLADTSSISRTSSDSSTQTQLSNSPGRQTRRTSHDPVPLTTELSGGSSSSSNSSSVFLIPGSSVHPPRSTKSLREHQNFSPDTKSTDNSISPFVSSSSSSSSTSSPLKLTSTNTFSTVTSPVSAGSSPVLKEGRVVLTPLSTELISCQIGALGNKMSGDIATPPTSNINPPLSGSTPMILSQKDDSASDITTSNSPEIPFPVDSLHGTDMTSFPFDNSSAVKGDESVNGNKESTSDPSRIDLSIPVLARPARECYYYPGLLQTKDSESGKYTVYFEDDGRDRQIRETDILLIDMLPVGQEVYAQSDSDDSADWWYSAGTIVSYWRDDDDKRGYVITKPAAGNNKTKRYTRKQVIVKLENLSNDLKLLKLQPASGLTTADVSLDNIMDGKRRTRRSRAADSAVSSPAASRPGTPSSTTSKTPRSSRKRRADSESSESSSCVPFPTTKKSKRGKLSYGSPRTPAKRKSSNTPSKASMTYKESKLFEKCGFLLTSTTGKDHPSSEFDSPPCTNIYGYDREVLKKQINAGDGVVVKDFTQLMSCDRSELYVVSDNFCRTMNYFNALAAGIQCISYIWINDSTNAGRLKAIKSYVLPAGYSLQHMGIVERPISPIQPLSGIRVSLHMRDLATWNPLLCIAGCISVSTRKDKLKTDCSLSCDVVVADSSCDQSIMERAEKLKIPVVSIEWVIQCLINNKKLPFIGHSQYSRFT